MALKLTRHCDAFGTTKEVRRYYLVLVERLEDKAPPPAKDVTQCWSHELYLSMRGRARMESFVGRGIVPPGKPPRVCTGGGPPGTVATEVKESE